MNRLISLSVIAIDGDEKRQAFREQLTEHGFESIDLTDNELAKTHVRYMVGGRSHDVDRGAVVPLLVP